MNREIESDLINTAKELGINVVVYGAVGHGILTEKVFNEVTHPMMSRGILSPQYKENNMQALQKFNMIAKEMNLDMSELALSWTQSKYDNIITLIGTTKPNHLESSIKAINTQLSPDVVNEIEKTLSNETIKGITKRKWIFTNGIGRLLQ